MKGYPRRREPFRRALLVWLGAHGSATPGRAVRGPEAPPPACRGTGPRGGPRHAAFGLGRARGEALLRIGGYPVVMGTEPTYRDLLIEAFAAEFGADPASLGERELTAAQVIVNQRARARWLVLYRDRAHCRPVFTGDPHDLLEVLARRWPRPLTIPD